MTEKIVSILMTDSDFFFFLAVHFDQVRGKVKLKIFHEKKFNACGVRAREKGNNCTNFFV